MNKITYNPGVLNKIVKRPLIFLKSILPESLFKSLLSFIHNFYKVIQRYIYLIIFLSKYFFLSKEKKNKYTFVFKLLPFTMGGSKALENAYDMIRYVDKNKIEGGIIECGVAEGGTSAMMALTNRIGNFQTRNLYLFDSFEGLPSPTSEDFYNGTTGDFIRPLDKGDCLGKIEDVKNLLFKKLNLNESKTELVKGWFQDTIPAFRLSEKIAVLRLDGDWYDSTRIPLENFFDNISIGGVIIIDDYATCYGSKKAVDEFISNLSFKPDLKPDGRGGAWFIKEA